MSARWNRVVHQLLVQVYKTGGSTLLLMKVVALLMLLVAVAATIASCQNIIVRCASRLLCHAASIHVFFR